MAKVAIVYFSGAGHTKKLAESVLAGVKSVEACDVNLIALEGLDIHQGRWNNDAVLAELDSADAIIFGSPTYMGKESM